MKTEHLVRAELLDLLNGGGAHMEFAEVIEGLTVKQVNAKPSKTPYSIWHMVEHIRIAQWDIIQFITNPKHVSPEYPDGYRPTPDETADEARWTGSVEGVKEHLAVLRKLVSSWPHSLLEPLAHAPNYSVFREVMIAFDHTAYHVGEIALMRQVMGFWPAKKPYLTGHSG